ncbi:threonine/serine exporter ThrE family protein [Parabacteroides sp. Marseille-P3160]|uniref:threonine/serine ThrE exporter family protein n=1 Tax=Parabacteroides sp. Marseille-P3160 TaxID=1917887 RepID=UPI0009B9A440|nr:threonine/serine exporter family protein [Parabacteroides sp. Marseille-P3160]
MEEKKNKERQHLTAQRVADLFLDIGTFLLASGAHSGRLQTNLGRMAETWGMRLQIHPTFKGLLVSVRDKEDPQNAVTCFKTSPAHSIHLENLTLVSRLSWKVCEERLPIDMAEEAFASIKTQPHYSTWLIAIAVGCSCSGLCLFAGGDFLSVLVTFIASFMGYLVQVEVVRRRYNPMLAITIAAFVTTIVTGLGTLLHLGEHPEASMATAVLYLVPGVPLINCVIDLIEGYLSSSINRALFAGFILLCIAAGMTLSIGLIGISNF